MRMKRAQGENLICGKSVWTGKKMKRRQKEKERTLALLTHIELCLQASIVIELECNSGEERESKRE